MTRWWAMAMALALAGCGSRDERVADAEEAIERVLAERLGRPSHEVTASCPDDADLAAGTTVTCDIVVGVGEAQPVAFAIGEGGVARLDSAVILATEAEAYLAGQLAGPAQGAVEVSCGDEELLVVDVGASFACDAVRTADQASFVVTVEVTGLDGTVRYRVEAPSTAGATVVSPPDPGGQPP